MAETTVQDHGPQTPALLREAERAIFAAIEAGEAIDSLLEVIEAKEIVDFTGRDYGLVLAMRACLKQIHDIAACHRRIDDALKTTVEAQA